MSKRAKPDDAKPTQDELAGIEYHGRQGISHDCQEAVLRLLQYGPDRVTRAQILSSDRKHCLLLTVGVGDLVAIKSGFASGYGGEGPATFSSVLQLLDSHGAEIDEYDVARDLIDRLDTSALTTNDLIALEVAAPVRPTRWHSYVSQAVWAAARSGDLWDEFYPVIPFAIVDPRIIDLALTFWDHPDANLLTAYRRLEDLVRERTGIDEHGQKLFARAFRGPLGWLGLDAGEQEGRVELFVGAFMAHRNPRAHKERNEGAAAQLREFLLLNHLYGLESAATEQLDTAVGTSPAPEEG